MFLVVTAQAAIFSFLILQTYNSFPLASTHFFLPTSKPTREKSIWKDLGKISCSTSNISNHLTIIFNIVLNVSLRLSRLVWILGPFFQGSFSTQTFVRSHVRAPTIFSFYLSTYSSFILITCILPSKSYWSQPPTGFKPVATAQTEAWHQVNHFAIQTFDLNRSKQIRIPGCM